MNLNNMDLLPHGTRVIIDSNIFIYAALFHPVFGETCRTFLKKVEFGEVVGYVPTTVLNEILYRFMITELIEKKIGKTTSDIIQRIKKSSDLIKVLEKTWINIDYIYQMNCKIITEKEDTFSLSLGIIKDFQLLPKDALIAAYAKSYNLTNIVSNDRDFNRIPWLSQWYP